MKKKIATLLIAGMVMAAMTGCNGKKADDAGKSKTESSMTGDKKSSSMTDEKKEGSSSKVEKEGEKKSMFAAADEVLNKVLEAYKEDQLFPVEGGDVEKPVMNKAGVYDISKKDELDQFLGLPKNLVDQIDGAASMIHQLNANTFTSASYHLKDGTDAKVFVKEIYDYLEKRQWVCGAPDTFLAIQVDGGYVITVFGKKELMDVFKEHATTVLTGSEVILEEGLVK